MRLWASRLLQLLHFTCWLVSLSTPSHALFQITHQPPSHLCSGEPDKCSQWNQWPAVRAKAHSDITVWLSRTLGWDPWVSCNVTLVAVLHSGSNLKYLFFHVVQIKAQLHANITKHLNSLMIKKNLNAYFVFVLILMLIHHTCLFNQLSDPLSVFLSLLAMHLG